jgi:23S rRNA (guanosine2251-2'-O)-methyltransferase
VRRPEPEEQREILYGVHPVLEALEMRKRSVDRILVASDMGGGRLGRLLRTAREAGVPISHLPRAVLSKKAGAKAVHQGVIAFVAVLPYADPDEVCAAAASRPDGLLVALHEVEDPRNLGAVVRTAAGAGASGVLVDGSAGLTATVAKASAGALERIAVAREPKLGPRLDRLRSGGFRCVALDPAGPQGWDSVDLTGRLVVALGGEGKGLSRRILDSADHRVRIPMAAGVESLNVSVAAGVLLFEAARQRRARS